MSDLSVSYMGLTLKNPLVASSSPLTEDIDNIRRLEDAGIAAVVLPSLFEEQLRLDSETLDADLSRGAEEFAEATSYLPNLSNYNAGPDGYLELIRQTKRGISIPVFASLNGSTPGGWVRYAMDMQAAGADAIELNLYSIETDPRRSAADVERGYCELVRQVKASVRIPLAVKLSPFLSSIPHMAAQLDHAGADALVLFNRFYQPDFDIESLEVVPRLILSQPHELLLRLHWVAILFGHVKASMAITGGVHRAEDVIKSVMAGANVAMMTSALLRDGIPHAQIVLEMLAQWLDEHEYKSIAQMAGSMSRNSASNPAAFERSNYMRVLSSYSLRKPS
jgi:dihydroorotate dehydrogenase (fumarate)